ncbi:TPA: hypothetical protein QDE50_30495 [Burkholderia cenocepacia]|nr:hypothetical protein [Burkholderia cenocepacia]HDR9888530.1 hypothetical protein [Burkholderia cenocepacia]
MSWIQDVKVGYEASTHVSWPLTSKKRTHLYFDLRDESSSFKAPTHKTARSLTPCANRLEFLTPTPEETVTWVDPLAVEHRVSSATETENLNVLIRLFPIKGTEILVRSTHDPKAPLAQGGLREPERTLDPILSQPFQPFQLKTAHEPLVLGHATKADTDVWPTLIAIPARYRLGLRASPTMTTIVIAVSPPS